MAKIITMPRLSDTMVEGKVVKWYKKIGDEIAEGDILADIETDKAIQEFESEYSGKLIHIGVLEGEVTKIDAVLAIIGSDVEQQEVNIVLPEIKSEQTFDYQNAQHNNIVEVPIINAPDPIQPSNVIINHESNYTNDRVFVSPLAKKIADDNGVDLHHISGTGDGGRIVKKDIEETIHAKVGEVENVKELTPPINVIDTTKAITPISLHAEPLLVQPMAIEIMESVQKQTENQIIVDEHIEEEKLEKITLDTTIIEPSIAEAIISNKENNAIIKESSVVENLTENNIIITSKQQMVFTEKDIINPVSHMRKVIARRLTESKFLAPHYYLTIAVLMDNAIASRQSINELTGLKISYNDFIIKAVAASLRKHPAVNASWADDNIIHRNDINIGVAVAVEDGLVVPVVQNADQKSLTQISNEIKDLATRARERHLKANEMDNSTFSISNLGMFGIESFTSIINQPNAGILSVGAILEKPVVKDGQIVVGNIMKLTLACDHRTVDGATGSTYLKTLKQMLENPVTILT